MTRDRHSLILLGGVESNTNRPEDRSNYVLLLREIRLALDFLPGERRLLTIATPANSLTVKNFDLTETARWVDFMNVMAYDFRGSWSKTTGHHAQLYRNKADPDAMDNGDIATSVQLYLSNGVPADKIVLGVPFYGRGFANVARRRGGLFQPYQGLPNGTEPGVYTFGQVSALLRNGTFKYHWDRASRATYAYSPTEKIMITFDGRRVRSSERLGLEA